MKKGYQISNYIYKSDNFIEVVNYIFINLIENIGWNTYESFLQSKDKNTIGVWKIKNKSNETTN